MYNLLAPVDLCRYSIWDVLAICIKPNRTTSRRVHQPTQLSESMQLQMRYRSAPAVLGAVDELPCPADGSESEVALAFGMGAVHVMS